MPIGIPRHDDLRRGIGAVLGGERLQAQAGERIAFAEMGRIRPAGGELRLQAVDLARLKNAQPHETGRNGVGMKPEKELMRDFVEPAGN